MRYDDPRWYEQPEHHKQEDAPSPSSQQADTDEPEELAATSEDALTSSTQQKTSAKAPKLVRGQGHSLLSQVIMTLAFMALAFLGGWFAHQWYIASSLSGPSQQYLNLFEQAWTTVSQNYVARNSVNYKQMSYDAIRAMVNDLGDNGHTRFETPQDVQAEQQQLSGSYAGIGIYIQQNATTKAISVLSTISGAPAEKAGMKAGDILIEVNGKNIVGEDFTTQVQPMIEGQAGTVVTITVRRPSTGQTLTFKITREQITVPNVLMHYIPEDHIAQIQIVQFSSGVSDQLKAALLEAKQDGATKIILDLRNNPGGYLQEAIDTASEFMASGTVLIEQDSSGHQTKYSVTGQPVDTGMSMVVLVNGGTASAAEIVSGALQDNHRAIIMGTKTFGTGTVLQEFDLSDGSALLLGVDEWLTPDGHFIRTDKITPNITVNMPTNGTILTPDVETQNNMTLAQIMNSGDAQLVAAIKYLQSH